MCKKNKNNCHIQNGKLGGGGGVDEGGSQGTPTSMGASAKEHILLMKFFSM